MKLQIKHKFKARKSVKDTLPVLNRKIISAYRMCRIKYFEIALAL